MQVIDIHNHFFPSSWPDLAARFGTPDWPWIKHTEPGKADIMVGDKFFRHIYSACWDPEVRLREMDRDGIDLQVISATPVLFAYERPVEQALDCAQLFNDAALELCSRGKGRLKSLCQVPLQNIDAACKELSRCMLAGHLGVQIGNHVGSKNLDDAGVVTFLHHCADEGAAVLVHPWEMFGRDRMPKYMMPWTVGMPAETQLSVVALILSGAFDRLPATLRICFAHGGGSFAFLLGRLENAWHHHPVARGECQHPPSHYVNRFSTDSAVFDQRALQFLAGTMGTDRVMLGSDYPFPLGEERVGSLIRESALSQDAKSKLLGENAMRFLGLETKTNQPEAPAGGCAASEVGSPVEVKPGQLTYSSYLKIPELLELQQPQSKPPHHDELLFILVHQTYELWFKELLHDLDAVVANLRGSGEAPESRDGVYEAARLLRRCTEDHAGAGGAVHDSGNDAAHAFSGVSRPAGACQRIPIGAVSRDRVSVRIERRENASLSPAHAGSICKPEAPPRGTVPARCIFRCLASHGQTAPARKDATEKERFEARARAVHALYKDEHHHRDWIDVCERLTEFDELVVSWRLRHIQLVERIIGFAWELAEVLGLLT